ncbi:hypothetical protein ACFQ6C_26360 [Streptomyces sp. NPDC056454]|uniref:hypothetical protein n=1 Tax=Streptomyces sp. NPDC056454 TaxID=3345823 RepID=UPI00368A9BA8
MKTWIKKNSLRLTLVLAAAVLAAAWLLLALDGFEEEVVLGVIGASTWFLLLIGIALFLSHASHRRRQGDELAKARPVNPGAPPHYQTLVRLNGDPETRCTCHDRPLADGETVLVWPGPDALLCQETHRNETTP